MTLQEATRGVTISDILDSWRGVTVHTGATAMSKSFNTSPKPRRTPKVKPEVSPVAAEKAVDAVASAAVGSTSTSEQVAGIPPPPAPEKKHMDVTTLNQGTPQEHAHCHLLTAR
jgi:hypothetical protein